MGIKINEYPTEGTDINDNSYIDVDQYDGVNYTSNKVKWITAITTALRNVAKLNVANVFTKQQKIISDGTNSPLVVRDSADTIDILTIRNSDGRLVSYKGLESSQNNNTLSAFIESVHSGSSTSTVIQQVGSSASVLAGVSLFASKGNATALMFMTNGNLGSGGTTPIQFNAGGYLTNVQMQVKPNGQVSIGTTTPNASAKLQVDSTTQGFLPPRMTTTERNAIATPAEGLMVYDTTVKGWFGYDGTNWIQL